MSASANLLIKVLGKAPSVAVAVIAAVAMVATFATAAITASAGLPEPTPVSAATNSPAANEASVRFQVDMMNRGDWTGALDFYTADSKNFGRPTSRAVMAKLFEDISTTFPDFNMVIQDLVAKDDWVIVRGRATGTHKGMGKIPLNGGLLVGVPPTHKHFEVDVMHWYKMRDGKIVDHYDTRDDLSMMQQLGLSPKPKPFDWARLAAEVNGP
jgi:predicted ester cyclase